MLLLENNLIFSLNIPLVLLGLESLNLGDYATVISGKSYYPKFFLAFTALFLKIGT